MRLNLSKLKKVHEDDHKAILQHPAGHFFTLAKKALSKENHEELKNVPMLKMADGGGVEDEEAQVSQPQESMASNDSSIPEANILQGQAPETGFIPQASVPAEYSQDPNMPSTNIQGQDTLITAQAPQDPFGTKQYMQDIDTAYGMQGRSIYGESEAAQDLAKQQANTYGTMEGQLKKLDLSTQEHEKNFQQKQNDLTTEFNNQKLDPHRYVSNMSTMGKIKTAIGLILGGIGGGINHTSNIAHEMLQTSINNDIAQQQQELGKKKSLLDYNLQQYKDMHLATQATRANMLGIAQAELMKDAAKYQGTTAGYKADAAASQLGLQVAQIHRGLAQQLALEQGAANGSVDPSLQIRMKIQDPSQQKEALKEMGQAQELVKGRDQAFAAFDQINHENTLGNRVMSPIQSSSRINAARDNVAVQLARDAAGRVNEYEFKAAKDLFPAVGDDAQTVARKRVDLANFVDKKMNFPTLKMYGINMGTPVLNRYESSGQKRIQLGPVK